MPGIPEERLRPPVVSAGLLDDTATPAIHAVASEAGLPATGGQEAEPASTSMTYELE